MLSYVVQATAPLGGIVSRRASRRWTLRSVQLLKHYMEFPGRGKPFSVRSLAEESGVGQGVIEKLLTGRQGNADVDDATALAEAVGSAIFPLFAPPPSPDPNRTSRTPTPTSEE
jgi:transcriptional regulator with XRE-family HTH domain